MKNICKKVKAFTLAEIMVVFMIISVVAAATIGNQKSRNDYIDKFMYYSTYSNLKKVISEFIKDGLPVEHTQQLPTMSCPNYGILLYETYTPLASLQAQTKFNTWKSAWTSMMNNSYNKDCGADAACTAAQSAVTSAANFFIATGRKSPNLINCRGYNWANTACSSITFNAESVEGEAYCAPAEPFPGFADIVATFNSWQETYYRYHPCTGGLEQTFCDNQIASAQELYHQTITKSHGTDHCPGSLTEKTNFQQQYTEADGYCQYTDPAALENPTFYTYTTTEKILPDTPAGLFDKFSEKMNSTGALNQAATVTDQGPFTLANANMVLPNGIRFFNFGSAAIKAVPADSTGMKDYYIIYADINGGQGNGRLNEDVMAFKVFRSGLVIPLKTTSPPIKYLSASVSYKDANGKTRLLETGVPYLNASCHAGEATGTDCPTGVTISPTCDTANGGFTCTTVINKPGF